MGKVDLFIDSGAFSAFTKGIEIDIQDYIQFIRDNEQVISVYANLDVIGDAEGTLRNQEVMEAAGLSPLPCFHYNEPVEYLEYYLSKYDYIALGGMVPVSTSDLISWLDGVFANYICDSAGIPKAKVHGFGLTSLKLMLRYPWYSVDSTSWVMTGRMGSVLVPKFRNNIFDYFEDPFKIVVSDRSPSTADAGKHFRTFTAMEQDVIQYYLSSKGYVIGSSVFHYEDAKAYKLKEGERWFNKARADGKREVETIVEPGLCNDYIKRDELNIIYYLDLERAINERHPWPWAFKLQNRSVGFGL